ncbi:universal stress protein [Spongisporangium articulatum]|uniref:Universal stress protein n=1 Tax=Spongisporangium articulatum TaxID=3362603 RepID=A0ABW8AMF3_9ACTN
MSVLVGFAPTPEGRAAIERAVAECAMRSADLVVVVSQARPNPLVAEPAPVTAGDILSLLAELGAADLPCTVQPSDPQMDFADQVLEVADDPQVELIVIGLRRRSGSGKLILGSSAQRILLEASCPVLAVKGVRVSIPADEGVPAGAREAL